MSNTLRAWRTPTGWVVDWADTEEANEIRELFNGTTTLPSGWTAKADAAVVQRSLEELNPGFEVVIA